MNFKSMNFIEGGVQICKGSERIISEGLLGGTCAAIVAHATHT